MMFRPRDLDRLRAVADVLGPFEPAEILSPARPLSTATAIITGWGSPRFTDSLLAATPNLKLLAHSAGSVKNLVDESTFTRGIRTTNAAAANAVPVAHYTVAMMVALLKQIPWLIREMTLGKTREQMDQHVPHIRELQDITVGLIGASRIGREVIRLLHAYPNVQIKLYDPFVTPAAAADLGVQLSSLEETCRCEVVSLHAPKVPATYHMMNAQTMSLLPDHAVLINTSRGALIDESALIAEVRRRPLYVLLDVTDPEPPPADSPLRREPNILLTPHIAGAMNQARFSMGELAIDEVLRFLNGQQLQHEVTLEMLPTQA
ncbi:MAG TPA: hydroxyacid dehydrogenase [Tepidisphaeraceae bacterium]|jgi:phosphoglycerate dehydrogenase-like enzyme|nr:hydroxyacid dehydrogenase [Tepidisphaeraceae bacterium]